MTIPGYMGKLLEVDLSKSKIRVRALSKKLTRAYLGGCGLASYLLYDRIERITDSLGSENTLIFMTGPLVGTAAPSCGRHVVCSKSPLTGLYGESHAGGHFGARLRFAGYDGLIITGKSASPTLLSIIHGDIQLQNIDHLQGANTLKTQIQIKKDLNERNASVACIGIAGENLVKYASIMNDGGRAAGRTGMGAIMGSKNLKAIAVAGREKPNLADRSAFQIKARHVTGGMKKDFQTQAYKQLGSAMAVGVAQETGAMPNKYFTEGVLDDYDNISGSSMKETILVDNKSCFGCPIGCGRVVEIKSGKYSLPKVDGPEYETMAAFGSLIMNTNLESIAYANHLCNLYGMDTLSCGVSIAFAYYLVSKNKLSLEEVGENLVWGNPDPMIKLIEKTANRSGFGKILAEGTRYMENLYQVKGEAAHVKGLEVTFWDPRAIYGMATTYATSPIGASHLHGDMYWVENGQIVEELGIDTDDPLSNKDKGVISAKCQDWRAVTNSIILCQFAKPLVHEICDLLTYATGIEYKIKDMLPLGERITNLQRIINLRLGLKPKDDTLPEILLRPLPNGPARDSIPNLNEQLDEFYHYRDWNIQTGEPSNSKLKSLSLDKLTGN